MFNEKNLRLLVNLGTYKPRFLALRILLVSCTATFILFIAMAVTEEDPQRSELLPMGFVILIVSFNTIAEANIFFMRLMQRNRRLRWNLYLQSICILGITLLLLLFWIQLAEKMLVPNIMEHTMARITITIGLLTLFIHLLIIIISNLTSEWMDNRKEIDTLKQAKLQSDYNSLKDRLNPHFLFNNLSVLKSLIHFNPEAAGKFTQDFTNVYRYVLSSHEEETVTLQEELKFLESYIALHKERIGEGLQVHMNIDSVHYTCFLPPMSLQLLVENAIKHNVANKTQPLTITIASSDEYILVRNNRNTKEDTYSSLTGLTTLRAQFQLLAGREVRVEENNSHYSVYLPLLSRSQLKRPNSQVPTG